MQVCSKLSTKKCSCGKLARWLILFQKCQAESELKNEQYHGWYYVSRTIQIFTSHLSPIQPEKTRGIQHKSFSRTPLQSIHGFHAHSFLSMCCHPTLHERDNCGFFFIGQCTVRISSFCGCIQSVALRTSFVRQSR